MAVSSVVFVATTAALCSLYLRRAIRTERRSVRKRDEAQAIGLNEPASLHPVIDPALCIGCGTCVKACPEGQILGLINGKAELVEPTHCIGHGACRDACAPNAISLVFGTAKRGIDIPMVKPNFETNVPGLFIAGELGGMGLVRNAIEQGRQAMEAIRRLDGLGREGRLDVVIVGAGPAGFAASLAAMEHGLRFVTLEQESFGGTVAHYPRGKLVMTKPVRLPLVGTMRFRETTKEKLMRFWEDVQRKTGLQINTGERVDAVERTRDGFVVTTPRGRYVARAVLLCIGRRGTPRKLGVPGEERDKVVYRMIDPEQYQGRHVLVVGGGDSALEAACEIAEQPGTTVTLSYRSASFSRAKPKNRERVDQLLADGRLNVLLSSTVKEIGQDEVAIEHQAASDSLRNDAVIVCAGGVLPTPFLERIGVEVETKYGTA